MTTSRLLQILSTQSGLAGLAVAGLIGVATAARADVTISSDATANMRCSAGICTPTASDAVLNVGDLETLLASGSVTVTTTGSGVQANNIDVTAKLGWSANVLTLDSCQSLSVTAPVTAGGKSGLSILTDDGGTGGELAFFGKGHVTFKNLTGKLAINGTNYTLVNSIASLAAAITKSPSGDYALASNYNAKNDGDYHDSPIATEFTGSFEGLGNKISNVSIVVMTGIKTDSRGFFASLAGTASISDFGLVSINFDLRHRPLALFLGALAGSSEGAILHSRQVA